MIMSKMQLRKMFNNKKSKGESGDMEDLKPSRNWNSIKGCGQLRESITGKER